MGLPGSVRIDAMFDDVIEANRRYCEQFQNSVLWAWPERGSRC